MRCLGSAEGVHVSPLTTLRAWTPLQGVQTSSSGCQGGTGRRGCSPALHCVSSGHLLLRGTAPGDRGAPGARPARTPPRDPKARRFSVPLHLLQVQFFAKNSHQKPATNVGSFTGNLSCFVSSPLTGNQPAGEVPRLSYCGLPTSSSGTWGPSPSGGECALRPQPRGEAPHCKRRASRCPAQHLIAQGCTWLHVPDLILPVNASCKPTERPCLQKARCGPLA